MDGAQAAARPGWQVAVEVAALVAAPLAVAVAACFSGQLLDGAWPWMFFAVGLLLGVLGADAVSGVVHWFCDNFLREDTPVLGSMFISPFREHHRDPLAITGHGVGELNGNNCLGVTVMCGVFVLLPWPGALASGALLGLCAALAVTNQIHSWAHAHGRPGWVTRMQRAGLILSPVQHELHHAAGGRGAYCVTTGWANGPLDRSGVFPWIEGWFSSPSGPP